MAVKTNYCKLLLPLLFIVYLLQACTRSDIEFGTAPENSYTKLVYIDTVGVQLSTVLSDSFATSSTTTFLLGRYKDPYFGSVTGTPYFQMNIPSAETDISSTARFDSLTLTIRLSDYYYGDTTMPQTIYVNELADAIVYTYNSQLFNTSSVQVKPVPLGSRTLRINPTAMDSIMIRLSDTKGVELFNKLLQKNTDILSSDQFLNYFRGISLSVADSDTAAIIGLLGEAGNMVMRVHYHTTIPYPESQYIDFTSLANGYAFNKLLSGRAGTGLVSGGTAITELHSSITNNRAYLQQGTGLSLKMTFPSLRTILTDKNITKLLKAELIVRPAYLSFDKNKYKLPTQLYLAETDETNLVGNSLLDSSGTEVMYADPVIDDIYGENNYYRFNVTAYINALLNTAGSEDAGLYIFQNISSMNANRLVLNTAFYGAYSTQLKLSVLVVDK